MIYLFYGENSRAAKEQINKLVERFKTSTGSDFGLHRFNEDSDPESVKQALVSMPMFSEASLVVLEHPSRSKELINALSDALETVPEKTVLAVYDPQIDKRTSWFKALQKQATVKEFTQKTPAQKRKWTEREVKARGGSISEEAVALLLEYVDDEWQLEQEIQKLANTAAEIQAEHIRQLVRPAPQQTVFSLLDALVAGRTQEALEHWQDLRAQNVHELEILAMLGWQVRVLLILAAAEGRADQQIGKDHGINPYVIRKSRSVARRLDEASLQAAYQAITASDYAIKTSGQEPDVLVEQLLMQLGEYLQPGARS